MSRPHRFTVSRCLFITLTATVAAVCFAPALAHAARIDLRVMSFNVRTGNADDGDNSWVTPDPDKPDRREAVVTTIDTFNPDILGLQEDLGYQGDYIRNQMPRYTKFGRGANADGSGEHVSILYRTSRFTKLGQGTFWLSPNPNTAGSRYDGAQFARIVNWLELGDDNNPGFTFVIMNTHWEHGGADAKDAVRLQSATLMRAKMTQIAPDTPIIFTGDFNADQGSDEYRRMTGRDDWDDERFLIDTYRNLHSNDSDTVGTAPGFDGVGGTGRIDWMLNTENFDVLEANIVRTSFDGRYPSDHFPINATIVPMPEPAGLALLGLTVGGGMLRRRREDLG
jgi:endonuclease/exonuclease/phosphatase family metal-dependent hydrolase